MVAMIVVVIVEVEKDGILNVLLANETVPKDLEGPCLLSETSTKSEISSNQDPHEAVVGESLRLTASTKAVEEGGVRRTLRRKTSSVKKRDSGLQQEERDRLQ